MKKCLRSQLNTLINSESKMNHILKGLPLKNKGYLLINKELIRLRTEYQGYIHKNDSKVTSITLGNALSNYLGFSIIMEDTKEVNSHYALQLD